MKNILCIRHGKAFHNVLIDKIGEKALFLKESYDAPLVEEGIIQAKELGSSSKQLKNIDIVFVSPLTRTVQTAEYIFENNQKVRIVALDKIKEFPQGIEICNKRRNRIELEEKFKKVDFSLLDSDEDQMWRADRYEKIEELTLKIKTACESQDLPSALKILKMSVNDWKPTKKFDTMLKTNINLDLNT